MLGLISPSELSVLTNFLKLLPMVGVCMFTLFVEDKTGDSLLTKLGIVNCSMLAVSVLFAIAPSCFSGIDV